jgi:hypothetical protein
VYVDPSGHSYCDSEYAFQEDCNGSAEAGSLSIQSGDWGVSDQELQDIISMGKMGDVIVYDVLGTINYAMFVLNNNGVLILWDMSSKQPISLFGIQNQIIGFYPFDKEENNFDLYYGIGNSTGAAEVVGSTIHFQSFPPGWGNGVESYVRFYRQSEFNCDGACPVISAWTTGLLVIEVAKFLAGSGGNPWILSINTAILIIDIARNIENGDPLVVLYPGQSPTPAPLPDLDFPEIHP